MLATFAASRDKPGTLALGGILTGESGAPIGETDGVCGGGSAAPSDPVAFCAPAPVGAGAFGTFESGSAPFAVGVLGGVTTVGVRVLGAFGGTLGAFAPPGEVLARAPLGLLLGTLGSLPNARVT